MVFNTGSLSVKVVPDSSPLEVSRTHKFTENNGEGVGLVRCIYAYSSNSACASLVFAMLFIMHWGCWWHAEPLEWSMPRAVPAQGCFLSAWVLRSLPLGGWVVMVYMPE